LEPGSDKGFGIDNPVEEKEVLLLLAFHIGIVAVFYVFTIS
jgi:hypothetical protein